MKRIARTTIMKIIDVAPCAGAWIETLFPAQPRSFD